MKILLDENINHGLRKLLIEHETMTCAFAGLSGLDNGLLLSAAEQRGFELLITADRRIPFQQSFTGRKISLLVLYVPRNRLSELKPLVPQILDEIRRVQPGSIVRVISPSWREPLT